MSSATLITGVGGYLGTRLARALCAQDREVIAWVHAKDPAQLAKRSQALTRAHPELTKARFVGGDLAQPGAFAGLKPDRIGGIVHAAAITRFDVDAASAQVVNVQGTAQVIELAKRCPQLGALVFPSTLYVSGLRPGALPEDFLQRPSAFANQYERSKFEAEELLRESQTRLPVRIVRVGTVAADDPQGRVVQRGALHHALELLHAGLLGILPGEAETALFVVDGQRATAAVLASLDRGKDGSVLHACCSTPRAPRLLESLERVLAAWSQDPRFAARRVQLPPLVDLDSFDALRSSAAALGGSMLARALHGLTPFAPQLMLHKQVDCAGMDALLGPDPTDPMELLQRAAQNLVARDGEEAA